MRPGLPRYNASTRRAESDVLLGALHGAPAMGGPQKPLALPPIPPPTSAPPAAADASSSSATKPASTPTSSRPAMPAGLRDGVRQPDGTLVPALALLSSTALVPSPPEEEIGRGGALVALSSSSQHPKPANRTGKALTARKPTDSDAGRLATKLMAMERTRNAAAGPVSQFPVHGGAASVRTAAGSCARPPLAIELEAFIRRELNMLQRQLPTTDPLAKIAIAREGFGCFITHFPEYAAPLELIKSLYDGAVNAAFSLRQQKHALETENIGFRDYHTTVLEKEKAEARRAAVDAKATAERLRALLDQQEARQRELELELHRMTNTLTERNQQLDEAEARAVLFEKSVVELTDKGIVVHQRLTAVRRDNERLQHTIATLEQQVREAEAGVLDSMAASSARRKSRVASTAAVKPGATISGSVGVASAMRNVVKEAVLGEAVRHNYTGNGNTGNNGHRHTTFAEDTGGSSPPRLDMASAWGGGGPDTGDSDDLDMPLPGEDTREAVLELESRLKRVTRQNYLLTSEREALLQRLESLQANLEREKNEMTPRPPWPTAQEILPGFAVNALATSEETLADLIQFFKDELTEEKREAERKTLSKTVRDWLGQEDLCEGDLVGKHRYFVCRGTGDHVPVYLRAKGVVRNRKIRKGDVEKLLAKLWYDRRIALRIETNLNATPLADFFLQWLVGVTGNPKAAVELAYNMLAVCEQYQQDPDCGMFIRILRGELCEHAMFEQADILENLLEVMRANDPRKKKMLSRFTIHRILNKFFPTKSRQDTLRLRFSLAVSCKGATMVDYEGLFAEDEEGNQSRFVEVMRRQHVEEATSFTVAVEEALREAIRDDGVKIDLNNARMALKHLDPVMPNTRIEDVMAFGCGMTLTELERFGQFFAVDAEPFLERIRRGVLLHRYSRAVADEDGSGGESEDEGAMGNMDDDGAERQRARESGVEDEDADLDIVIPEAQMHSSTLFSEGTRTVDGGGTSGGNQQQQQAAGATGTATAAGADGKQSPHSPGVVVSIKTDAAGAAGPHHKKLMTAAEKKEDFHFLDAFTKPAAAAAKRRGSRRASALASLDTPPEGASRPDRRKSLAEALTEGSTISAATAFAAVTQAMDDHS